ncbi:MAG: ABC transporter ATP-binding protein [Caldilineaceae bacterium]
MPPAIEMLGISKYFPSSNVQANRGVDFVVEQGEVHALVGENGAGKTTLMNILYGLVQPDSGERRIHGQPVQIHHPNDAIRLGIGMVHQHFKLVPSFTVAENILLGLEETRAGLLRPGRENEMVEKLAADFGLRVNPRDRVQDLPVGMQQRVEILKALQRQAQILLLDEPTAVLTPQEVHELFEIIGGLAARGRTIVLITHKLPEVMAVTDRVTVMRRGEVVGRVTTKDTSIPELAKLMVGREVLFRADKVPAKPGQVVLDVKNAIVAGPGGTPAVIGTSLQVRAGEIVGIAGVNGNGQSELIEAISGLRPLEGGSVRLLDQEISHMPVRERREQGMAHIPEDRLSMGLNTQTTLDENVVVSRYRLPEFSQRGMLNLAGMHNFAEQVVKLFSVAAARPGEGIANLSGGNLQKVVIGRELAGNPKLIIANQPTRGLDVGSIEFVHKTLIAARDRGAAILLVSVELDEIQSLSDRILVMYSGQIAGEVAADVSEEELGILMAGGKLSTP